jgi:hypothetical protein
MFDGTDIQTYNSPYSSIILSFVKKIIITDNVSAFFVDV